MSQFIEVPTSPIASRRSFLRMCAAGSGALGLGAVSSQSALAACEPPGNPTTPTAIKHDCRPIRPRRPASTLTTAEVQKLRDAYKAMADLQTNDPNDPLGMRQQANV